MTKEKYMLFHEECCKKLIAITKAKNADYTGAGDDPFKNFRKRGQYGFLVRMDDKFSRIESFLEKGTYQVKEESFLDTCLDLANYAILLAGFMKEEQVAQEKQPPSPLIAVTQYSPSSDKRHMIEVTSKQAQCPHKDIFRESGASYGTCIDCGLELKIADGL